MPNVEVSPAPLGGGVLVGCSPIIVPKKGGTPVVYSGSSYDGFHHIL